MNRKIPAIALAAVGLLAACGKPKLPDAPPAPKADAPNTQMRDAIKKPLDEAKAAAALEQQAVQQRLKQAGEANASSDESTSSEKKQEE